MSLGVLEVASLLGFGRYFCKRCCHAGYSDSKDWSPASYDDFEPVPRMCRIVLAVYEDDLSQPKWAPEGGYRMDIDSVLKRAVYKDTQGEVAPYLIYVDHDAQDIVLAIRGLNLGKKKDYEALLNNKPGKEHFDNGFVHHGLLKSARWLLNEEADRLKDLLSEHPSYKLSVAGHSLGSGVAAMFVMLVANDRSTLGNIARNRIRCYAIAPARCMSLNLAVRHADIIYSVILQDDFLPRTVTPLEDIFKSIFCLPCLIFSRCLKDTFMWEKKVLKDPRRLYTPGTVFHIVDRRFCGTGTLPPFVRRAVPVEGRFEHVILSCNATKDHSLIWIEKESQKALEILREEDDTLEPPPAQKMTRKKTMKEQHKAALEKAQSLNIPNAFSHDIEDDESSINSKNDIGA
ncbi:hypothetical protein L7F22_029666 [Adiantum nelumboides]|nr:hypothetical protein [Adiantum nelumboides]